MNWLTTDYNRIGNFEMRSGKTVAIFHKKESDQADFPWVVVAGSLPWEAGNRPRLSGFTSKKEAMDFFKEDVIREMCNAIDFEMVFVAED